MAVPFSIVDAGRAAAVLILRQPVTDRWMRGLAAFLELPVTAFVWPSSGGFEVRLHGAEDGPQ